MRSLNVEFGPSGSTRSIVMDRDTTLVAVNWAAGSAVISAEPQLTYDNSTTISADRLGDEFRIISFGSGFVGGLNFPLSKGQEIFVAPGGGVLGSSLQLFFEEFT